jgi:transcriptional regulator GlxA family with amidase domain
MNLSIIAHTLDPVYTWPTQPGSFKSKFTQGVLPTHTFDNPPEDLEVLLVPGGWGMYEKIKPVDEAVEFIKRVYPKLKYLCTICTGSVLVARAGIIDGREATSNKMLFSQIKESFPAVNWVAKARWVVDGNVYTASGVTAGIDMILGFVEDVYGKKYADELTDGLEYERHTNSTDDPFAAKYGLA